MAQLVELLTLNQKVVGSSPTEVTKKLNFSLQKEKNIVSLQKRFFDILDG